jgi:uncharacterized membrane protein YphA (DoxX/SURF4 family)
MNAVALAGRILMASIFVASGLVKLLSASDVRDVLIAHHLDVSPALGMALVVGSALLELAGAVLLILGLRTRLGVGLLMVGALGPGRLSLDARKGAGAPRS